MRKYVAIWFVILVFSTVLLAQSGRKGVITNSPPPSSETKQEPDYSESAPKKPRPIYSVPDYRNAGKRISAKPPSNSQAQTTGENIAFEDDIVKVETNLVTIPVSVFDRNGLYIPNLKKEDFKIFEDSKEQEIAYFGTTEKPFTIILLIDTSPSTEYKIDEIRSAATAFVDQLKPQDSVMVIEFDANVHVLTEATSDRQKIYKAIKKADFGGGTSLYEAVDFSLRKRLGKIQGRKAIVLFTDGVDTASYKASYDSTLLQAEEADALIFPIYYNTFYENRRSAVDLDAPGVRAEDYVIGKKYIEELAENTGGRVFRPEAVEGGLTAAFEGIAEELRRQYNIGYYPPEEDRRVGQRKQIKVRVNRPNLVIRSRDSYIVGAEVKSEAANASKPQ
ncbi:MAG: VWA domain-containing protein [Pyrinomonadaceae bacterium]|nr:VWA domain-containing protein [Pyrinomonadaceae bacterium]